jgi:hypothetical protein
MFILPSINEDDIRAPSNFDFTKYRRHSIDTLGEPSVNKNKKRSESEFLPKAPPISILRHASKTSLDRENTFYRVKFKEKLPEIDKQARKSMTEYPFKQHVDLFTTKARLEKSSKSPSSMSQPRSSKMEIMKPVWDSIRDNFFRKQIESKTEDLKRTATNVEQSIRQKQTLLRYKYPLRRQKSKTESMGQFIDEIKRLNINDNETPLPDEFKSKPLNPRIFSQLSIEGQYALMKTYEDTIFNELLNLRPDLAPFMPRVLTSKFKLRPRRRSLLGNAKQNPFASSTNTDDSDLVDRQLSVSQQLEIAQEILDFINKAKGDYVTNNELDDDMDILKTYASYCKIWSKYFHLR